MNDFIFVLKIGDKYVGKTKVFGKKLPVTANIKDAQTHNKKIVAMCKAEKIMRLYGVYAECLQIE